MAIITTEAIILRKTELRETSLIVDFFTRSGGKIKGVIKGVRTPEPRSAAAFEVLSLDRIVYYEKKNSDFFIVSQCDLVEYFPGLRRDLKKLTYASYMAEFIDATSALGQKNEDVFELLRDAMELISGPVDEKTLTRVFEIKVLNLEGLMPGMKRCVHCSRAVDISGGPVSFSIKNGGIACRECRSVERPLFEMSLEAADFVRRCPDVPLSNARELSVPGPLMAELDKFIKNFLNFHIQKRFKSVEFMEQVGYF